MLTRLGQRLLLILGWLGCTTIYLQAQDKSGLDSNSSLPAPGSRSNSDNVPFIGKSDAYKNPVRLAKTTGHVANYDERLADIYRLRRAQFRCTREVIGPARATTLGLMRFHF